MNLAVLPSPTQGVWHIGPVPIRGYAVAIIVGVLVAVWIAERRWQDRGGRKGEVIDVAVAAVPAGLIGGRLYHVITTPEPYFGPNGHFIDVFKVWHGGLGIWGAIALGTLGAWLVCRRRKIRFAAFADALAPALAVAQAIGRIGNWFNNELYGAPTDLPWRLRIYVWDDSAGRAVTDAAGQPLVLGYFHPTFLYELIWDLLVAGLVVLVDRRLRLGRGNAFALYVAAYCVGRFFVERLRIDEAELILGQRLNVWTSIIVFVLAVLWMVLHRGRREESMYYAEAGGPDDKPAAAASAPGNSGKSSTDGTSNVAAGQSSDKSSGQSADHPSDRSSDASSDESRAKVADEARTDASARRSNQP